MPKMGKNLTVREIAAKAGVSPATVSLVIQGKGNLKQETREAVNRVIVETGYKPRMNSGTNEPGRHFLLIVDDITNPYFHQLFKGLDEALEEQGHFVSMLSSNDSIERQTRLLETFWQSDIGGVVLVPASGTKRQDLRNFENRRRPLLMAVRRIGQSPFDYVGANPLVGIQLAADHLIAQGHNKIGFIGGYKSNHAYSERYAGFAASLMRHSIELNDRWVVNGGSTRAFGRAAMEQLMVRDDVPTAVIAYNDLVAIGAMDAIQSAGKTIGDDIAVIGYDDIPEAALQPIPLTSVATPAEKLGEVIGQSIAAKGTDEMSDSPIDITYPPRLIIRSSCGYRSPRKVD